MKIFFKNTTIVSLVLFLFIGCQHPQPSEKDTLNLIIKDIATQLKQSQKFTKKDTGTIALTTFVDLNKFATTSNFGRVLSESLFNELFIRGFNVADFRGQGGISVNDNGEFFITRDIQRLKNEVPNTYILIGTYTRIENNILINVRIMDNLTGKVISTARTIYKANYCKLTNGICDDNVISKKSNQKSDLKKPLVIKKQKPKRKIKIVFEEPTTTASI